MIDKRYFVNSAMYLCDMELSNTLSIFECADLLNKLYNENSSLKKEKYEIIQTILNYYNNDFNGDKDSFECLLEDIGWFDDAWLDKDGSIRPIEDLEGLDKMGRI